MGAGGGRCGRWRFGGIEGAWEGVRAGTVIRAGPRLVGRRPRALRYPETTGARKTGASGGGRRSQTHTSVASSVAHSHGVVTVEIRGRIEGARVRVRAGTRACVWVRRPRALRSRETKTGAGAEGGVHKHFDRVCLADIDEGSTIVCGDRVGAQRFAFRRGPRSAPVPGV
jgi:hypothetical protein